MSDSLKEAAKKCFRAAALEHLSGEVKYSIIDSFNVPEVPVVDPFDIVHDLLRPSEASTFIKPVANDLGEITGFEEETRSESELGAATSSMSLTRAPLPQTGVKGSSINIPFFPGGFSEQMCNILSFQKEKVSETAEEELALMETTEYLTRPPGFNNDVILPTIRSESKPKPVVKSKFQYIFEENLRTIQEETKVEKNTEENENIPELDELSLDDGVFGRKSDGNLKKPANAFVYARDISTTQNIPEYAELEGKMAKEYPFELDPFQQASVICMEKGESLFVAAHTSAGKTVVAEYAVALCKQHKTKAIYTSPIKALSNQKFRDFKLIFEDVGLVTGDIQLNPEAFCLIMTTEILRSMLYNGSEIIRDLEWVIFDEVHYINNEDRGHVWEEVLIMLPAHVKIVMLSATVPNCIEFADWVGRIKNRRINVFSTLKRPVPLEHYLYTGQDGKTKKNLFKIIDANKEWLPLGFREAQESKKLAEKQTVSNQNFRGGRGGGARGNFQENRGGYNQRGNFNNQGQQRFNDKTKPGSGGGNPKFRNDKNIYLCLVDHLKTIEKLPVVIFVFSRKRCDDNAQHLASVDLTTNVEKGQIKKFFNNCIDRLKGSDKHLPQVKQMEQLCLRGFAIHHSGILPILKEVVELLFQQGLVKILFATETFAMGVNMPARTVVFDAIEKHDGKELRTLQPGEYIQMAGRAGRRGLDTTGTVIVVARGSSLLEAEAYKHTMNGKPAELQSKFRVTYSMLLNLLRVEQLKIEDMLQRSYAESASLRGGLDNQQKLNKAMEKLETHGNVECEICKPSFSKNLLRDFHDDMLLFLKERRILWSSISINKEASKLLATGRVLIITSTHQKLIHRIGILLKEYIVNGLRELEVFVPCSEVEALPEMRKKQMEEWMKLSQEEKDWQEDTDLLEGAIKYGLEEVQPTEFDNFKVVRISSGSIVAITSKQIRIDANRVASEASQRDHIRFRGNPIDSSIQKIISELNFLAEQWHSGGTQVKLPGIDFPITGLDISTTVNKMNNLRKQLLLPDHYPAKNCTHFIKHLEFTRSRLKIEREVEKLRYQLSVDALIMSADYQNRLQVLKKLEYVKESDTVGFKGRVACEIHHQELLITELILENRLHARSVAEVAAILSVTTCQHKSSGEVKSDSPDFQKIKMEIEETRDRLEQVGNKFNTAIFDAGDEIRFDLMEAVYYWASGMPFAKIMDLTDAHEGIIVRCIQRLSEVCKDVRNAAKFVGDPTLCEKMEQVSAAIKRDIVFAASLYTTV